jgi:DNA-binding MarR family transcriptional regulator
MKLTRRQETFMRQLLALYAELQEPIHYSALAEQIGVSRITAYDMLRVLEEKGYVESVYQLAPGRSGPGRSTILYRPTEKSAQAIQDLAAGINAPDWETLTDDIIQRMQMGGAGDAEMAALTAALLARIPPEGPPEIRHCTELLTIIVLNLNRDGKRSLLCNYVPHILGDPDLASAEGLMLLAGGAFGLAIGEHPDQPEWNRELVIHVKRYYRLVGGMSSEQRHQLVENLQTLLPSLCEDEGA